MLLVSELWPNLKRVTGTCDEDEIYRLLNLAISTLANKGLFDPSLATLDFYADGGFFFALPRDVKTPIRININNNPSFARSRIFEFSPNTDGTVDGEENGWSWSDRGLLPIQDERQLPSKVSYFVTDANDAGAVIKIFGRDEDGREISEEITGAESSPIPSTRIFHSIDKVIRAATTGECYLKSDDEETIARYYGDERVPQYRVIKLSQKAVACRMLYRRQTFKITSQDSTIDLNSEFAVVQAVKAVKFMEDEEYEAAEKAWAKAKEFIEEEQASRDEHTTSSQNLEAQTATNQNISTRDLVIMADVYDEASEIFGPVGRQKIFDKVTNAIEALANKGNWDASRGFVDLWPSDRSAEINPAGRTGDAYYVLPRCVESILAINLDARPLIPRNQWSEFHLNGTDERYKAPCRHWEDSGITVLLNNLPISATTKKVIPTRVVAFPLDSADDGTEVKIYGYELDADGVEIEVFRNGTRGWTCPCAYGLIDPGANAPYFTRITRITKAASTHFVKLMTVDGNAAVVIAPAPEVDESAIEAEGLTLVSSSYTGDASFTAYGIVQNFSGNLVIAIFGDAGFTDQLASTTLEGGLPETVTLAASPIEGYDITGFSFTLGGLDSVPEGDSLFTITRTYTAAVEGGSTPSTLATDRLLGYWEPDETEPNYRLIKLPRANGTTRIRVMYRKRTRAIRSMYDSLQLQNRLAIVNAMRAIEAEKTDMQGAANFMLNAIGYLKDQEWTLNATGGMRIQFNPETWPGGFQNIT